MGPQISVRPSNMFSMQALSGGPIIQIPNPDTDSAEGLIATLVNSGRNASAVVTAQKIGRDQDKTSLDWSYLTKDEWEMLLRFWNENFFFSFTYYSPVRGFRITRKFYISDRTYKPFDIDGNGNPTAYKECSAKVVDTGEGN